MNVRTRSQSFENSAATLNFPSLSYSNVKYSDISPERLLSKAKFIS